MQVEDGADLRGYVLSLRYDPAVLTIIDAQAGSLTAAWGAPVTNDAGDIVYVAHAGVMPQAGAGSLLEAVFTCTEGTRLQDLPVSLEWVSLNDGAIPALLEDEGESIQ